ncbi:MAG: TatD family hydrolase [Anaerotignaceae bacterium]
MYFDSHAHYNDPRFKDDINELMEDMHNNGVDYILNSGESMKSIKTALELTEKFDFVYAAVGVHPHNVAKMEEGDLSILKLYGKKPKVKAIGEIGLDFYYDNSPRDDQRFWFKKQLELAKELDMPVIIHSRDASQECFDIIKESGVRKGVVHCYSGSAEMALDYVKMGFYIGIGGVVTYSNAKKLVEVAKEVPLNAIVIETDCPYLSPNPNRGKRNDSNNLKYVVEKIAVERGLTHEDVANATSFNAKKLFGI